MKKRAGGSFSEKMLTLTVPHLRAEETQGALREAVAGMFTFSHVNARMAALRLAWPKFMRLMRRWLKRNDPWGAQHFAYYRLFEWTRGSDGFGHPHFHVYLFCPWLPAKGRAALLRSWWVQALESIGCPVPRRADGEPCVVVDLKRLNGFNFNALRELVKSGNRTAIENVLGTMTTPGLDAVDYAAAWTMTEAFASLEGEAFDRTVDVQRDLYVAAEGRRLAQGSRGFLGAPPISVCEGCGSSLFVAAVVCDFETTTDAAPEGPHQERGPP